MSLKLFAPKRYWELTKELREAITNGCGTGGWKGKLVPDHLWFLNIKEACNIHDYMYYVGETIQEKDEADRVFLNNMLRIIDFAGGLWILQRRRRRLAIIYYEAVKNFGGPAFWASKNKPEEYRLIEVLA